MAVALTGLRRFEEAVTAEQQALRLSDGKHGWMHFNLGSAYFSFKLQFQVQAFNLFNHANYYVQNGDGINQLQYNPVGTNCEDGRQ